MRIRLLDLTVHFVDQPFSAFQGFCPLGVRRGRISYSNLYSRKWTHISYPKPEFISLPGRKFVSPLNGAQSLSPHHRSAIDEGEVRNLDDEQRSQENYPKDRP